MKKPEVDLGECTLCGGCMAVCPEVFQLNDVGFMEVVEMTAYPEACVDEAIKYCPEDCIYWVEE
jgi:ferredoxin